MASAARMILLAMVVLGAFLTFSLEPMTGRLVTPIYGGSIHVWNVCVMVFQGLFLLATIYAHTLARQRRRLHLLAVVGVALFLPIGVSGELAPEAPTTQVIQSLLAGIGFPFFILATTSVIAQAWWADSEYAGEKEPYALFAGSNMGSLIALIGYPMLLERWVGVGNQSLLWSAAFLVYACLVLIGFRNLPPRRELVIPEVTPKHYERWPFWLALSAVPSALSLALTNIVASELGSFPLFWVLPLALYLGSFALAFRDHDKADSVRQIWPDMLLALLLLGELVIVLEMHVLLYSAFFVVCWISHEALYQRRPEPGSLTEFYVVLAAGGWLGGLFVTIIAPLFFQGYWEFPISILAMGGVFFWAVGLPELAWWRTVHIRLSGSRAVLLVAVASLYTGLLSLESEKGYIQHSRNHYGVFSVAERTTEAGERYRELSNGSTSHGKQYLGSEKSSIPVSYYHPSGANGLALSLRSRPSRMAGVGLGAGAMASYLNDDESVVFYEINPLSEVFARQWFSYLDDAKGEVEVRVGDARLLLSEELDQSVYDLLFIDAFAGDGIPTHLLTREAFTIYESRLSPDGLIVLHISNRYYDLRGVIRAAANTIGFSAVVAFGDSVQPSDDLADPSSTAVLCRDRGRLEGLLNSGWTDLLTDPEIIEADEWTDDFVDILQPFFAMRVYRKSRL